ncbi:MAG: 3-isopropylmalate dehydratase small subunit [Treponema sp.]|nr:3-isopropylmalate dehydratase small subunit [Treponema sp.]
MAKVFKYGDSVDTDVILPARYLALYKGEDLAQHCLEDIDENFAKSVKEGDIIVAGDNFGCGSSREHAPASIKACGVSCVIAVSFARIFYRNAINIGLPIFECPEAAKDIQNGDELDVNLKTAEIKNLTRQKTYQAAAFPPFIQRIIDAGGLLSSINT